MNTLVDRLFPANGFEELACFDHTFGCRQDDGSEKGLQLSRRRRTSAGGKV